jgi:hypothetical protein
MYYVFCMHEKELVRQKSLFFCKQRVERSNGPGFSEVRIFIMR